VSGAHASTQVVILAAGKGSRLGAVGADTPKWLLDVGARTIAERQLEAAELARSETDGAIGPVHVVTGHAADEVTRFLSTRSGNGVTTIYNRDFADLNNWYSVLLALRSLGDGGDDRVVIMNGDLFARPAWVAAFLAESATTDSTSLIGVDLGRRLTDESMKVSAGDGDPAVVGRIGKVGVNDPVGEYVGLLMARGQALRSFRAALERFVGDEGSRDEWYERAVGLTAAQGTPWFIWPTPDSDWVEIDDDGDLQIAIGLANEERR
jgi:choline kinase